MLCRAAVSLAGFQVATYGRFGVATEEGFHRESDLTRTGSVHSQQGVALYFQDRKSALLGPC